MAHAVSPPVHFTAWIDSIRPQLKPPVGELRLDAGAVMWIPWP